MAVSLVDSPLWGEMFGAPRVAKLLDDQSLLNAMIGVEIALAHATSEVGLAPDHVGEEIGQKLTDVSVSAQDIAEKAAQDGVPVPALVAKLRDILGADLGPWLHLGATSQDIVDTAQAVQMRKALCVMEKDLKKLLKILGDLAQAEADTIVGARTRTQLAMPSTFGAMVANWGIAFIEILNSLREVKASASVLSMHGAVGTSAAFRGKGESVRQAVADELNLNYLNISNHNCRMHITDIGHVTTKLATALGRVGQDIAFLAATNVGEISVAGGGSSTMPHKVNPVLAEALQSTARFAPQLQASIYHAAIHGSARDGAAWALEWHSLRQLVCAVAGALENGIELLAGLKTKPAQMEANLETIGCAAFSEAISFALIDLMSRPEAVNVTKEALAQGNCKAYLAKNYPTINWANIFNPLIAAGEAPQIARNFAATTRKFTS